MAHIPFLLGLDTPAYYGHDTFPNRMFRRLHPRHHDPLDMHTLGLIARLGPHAHQLAYAAGQRNGELGPLMGKDKDNFEIHLDVGLFEPGELSVKVLNDHVVVEGKHEEREDDHGHVSRHFVRRYAIPTGFNYDAIESTLSTDGVLTVKVPKIQENKANERVVEIKQIGPSDLFLKNGNGKEAKPAKEEK